MKANRIVLYCVLLLGIVVVGCKKAEDGRIPLTSDSEPAKAHFRAGMAHLECARIDSARYEFAEAVQADPEFAMGYLGLSVTQPKSEEMNEQMSAAEELSRPVEKSRRQQVRVGLVLPAIGGTGSSEMVEQASRRIDRVSEGERLSILAHKAQIEGDHKAELQALTKLVELYPKDEQAHQLLATYYTRYLEFDKAVREYQKAIECKPNCALLHNMLGYCYAKQEQYEKADAAFRRYIELMPNEANPYDSYAELLLTMNRHEESLENYQKAIARDSTFLNPRIGAAVNLMFLKRYADAKQMLMQPLAGGRALRPDEQRAVLYTEATIAFAEQDTSAAIEFLRERLRLARADKGGAWEQIDALDLLGRVYGLMGKPDSAAFYFGQCLSVVQHTEFPATLKAQWEAMYHGRMAVWVCTRTGDLEGASAHLTEMENHCKGLDSPGVAQLGHFVRGLVLLERGDPAEAIREFKQGKLDDPLVLFQTGVAYERNQDHTEAQKCFDKALKTRGLNSLFVVLLEPQIRATAAIAA